MRPQRLRRSRVSVCGEALSADVLQVLTVWSSVPALTRQKPEITPPDFSTVQVTDIFQKLVRIIARPPQGGGFCLTRGCLLLQGPLSVFCARARWGPARVICLRRREGGLGLTLRGDSPVLVAGVVPGGCAAVRSLTAPPRPDKQPIHADVFWQEAGLREGDYIVAVDGQDCKWAKHAEVVHLLKNCSDGGVELSVVTLHSHDTQVRVGAVGNCGLTYSGLTPVPQVERRATMLSHNKDKENTRQRVLVGAKGRSSASLLNWNRKKKREGSSATARRLGSTFSLPFGRIRDAEEMY